MAINSASDLLSEPEHPPIATTIGERLSQELIIALVGPVGSGVSTSAAMLRDLLYNDFGYNVCPIIKPRDIIKAEAIRVGKTIGDNLRLDQYISEMQDTGNLLRQKFGGNYLAEKVVEQICRFRRQAGGYTINNNIPLPGRRAYIIDSLKNLGELELLKQIYGETLCVVGIFAPDAQRQKRLIDDGVSAELAASIMNRDQGEVITFGQNTRKLFVNANFFVCNDHKKEELRAKIARLLNITFDTVIHTPSRAEAAMYAASSSAANSACMSRQVGAAILSRDGELISVGWNDVPRFGGSLYSEDDQSVWDDSKHAIVDKDHRCFKWKTRICHNETRRTQIAETIIEKFIKAGVLKRGIRKDQVRQLLEGTGIDSLIEFSRSIHAEMEAIIAVAREGKHSLVGATLYTNTYPCHNCARHIVASGISSVVYIEPYLKSLAIDLHNDAITEDPDDKTRVVFRQYDGVAPRSFVKLFRPEAERKRNGKIARPDPRSAIPVFRVQLDSLGEYESKVIADLSSKEQTERH